jgi:hypothetical protein
MAPNGSEWLENVDSIDVCKSVFVESNPLIPTFPRTQILKPKSVVLVSTPSQSPETEE